MKYLLTLLIITVISSVTIAQTLQTVVNNGNTVTTPVKFFGRADFGELWDPTAYGAVQITRAANQGNQFHLSFVRGGQSVYGMGFLNNSNIFGLQPGGNNSGTSGIFIANDGKVGIGTTTLSELFSVKGKIRAQEIKVELANWPDYVFAKEYKLPSLQETEQHIKEKGHLPGIPPAEEVKKDGVELGDMNAKLLQKIEELTLHLIKQNKSITMLQNQNETLLQEFEKLKKK